MNENLNNENKELMNNSYGSNKSRWLIIILIMIIIILTCIIIFLLVSQNKNSNEIDTSIKYEVKDNRLYVSNKVVEVGERGEIFTDSDLVFNLDDLLLVGDCTSWCDWYFVDNKANVIGSFGRPGDQSVKELFKINFNNITVDKVNDKTIYYTDYDFIYHGYDEKQPICEYADNRVVYEENKVVYNGNRSFSEPENISSKTKKEILSEYSYICE